MCIRDSYNREHISRLDEAEALLQNKPDSALTILKQLRQEGSQAEQARYALLYSEALDKNHIKVTDDSLIRQAWSHYKHYSKDLRHQCKTLYYWGRIKLRAGDKPVSYTHLVAFIIGCSLDWILFIKLSLLFLPRVLYYKKA